MECAYCKDPVLKFQEQLRVRYLGKQPDEHYHRGCYDILLRPETITPEPEEREE